MNNLLQKKILAQNKTARQMPYRKPGYIEYEYELDNDARIDAQSLNNTFQQLVDNDIYLENRINAVSKFHTGPKTSKQSTLEQAVDGYKYWQYTSEGNPEIYRKQDIQLSQLISSVYEQAFSDRRIIFSNNGVYYAAAGGKLLSSATGYLDWEIVFSDGDFWKYMEGQTGQILMSGDDACFISSSDDGAYTEFVPMKRFAQSTAAGLNGEDRFFIASENRLSSARFTGTALDNVQEEGFADCGEIRDIAFTDGGDAAVATDTGLFITQNADFVENSELMEVGDQVNQITSFGGYVYFATKGGLKYRISGGFSCVPETDGLNVPHIEVYEETLYYCIDDDESGGVYMLDSNDAAGEKLRGIPSNDVKDFRIYNGIFFVKCGSGLYFRTQNEEYTEIKYDGQSLPSLEKTFLKLCGVGQSGTAMFYAVDSDAGSTDIRAFRLGGTVTAVDEHVAASDPEQYSLNGNSIGDESVRLVFKNDSGQVIAVTENNIYNFSDFSNSYGIYSDINDACFEDGTLLIATTSGAYVYDACDLSKSFTLCSGKDVQKIHKYKNYFIVVFSDGVQVFTTSDGFYVQFDKSMEQPENISDLEDAVPGDDGIYVLKTDGTVLHYDILAAAFEKIETGIIADEIKNGDVRYLEVLSSYSENPDEESGDEESGGEISSWFEIAALTPEGLHVQKCMQIGDSLADGSMTLSNVIPGNFDFFFRDGINDDNIWLGANGGISTYFNKDVKFRSDPSAFIDTAVCQTYKNDDHEIYCLTECLPDQPDKTFYIAGTEHGFDILKLYKDADSGESGIPAAHVFSDGVLAYVKNDGEQTKLVVRNGDAQVSSDALASGTELTFGFEIENSAGGYTRMLIGTTDGCYYYDYYGEKSETEAKFGKITFKYSSTVLNFKHGTVVYDDNSGYAIVVFVHENGRLYTCTYANVFNEELASCTVYRNYAHENPVGIYAEYDSLSAKTTAIRSVYADGTISSIQDFTLKSTSITGGTFTSKKIQTAASDHIVPVGDWLAFENSDGIYYVKQDASAEPVCMLTGGRFINDDIIAAPDGTLYMISESDTGLMLDVFDILNFDESKNYDYGKIQAVFGKYAFIYDNTLRFFNPSYIQRIARVETDDVTAAAFDDKTGTLFMCIGDRLAVKTIASVEDAENTAGYSYIDIEQTVKSINVRGDSVIAVAEHGAVWMEYDGRSWIASKNETYCSKQYLNGIACFDASFYFEDLETPFGLYSNVFISKTGVLNGDTWRVAVENDGEYAGILNIDSISYFNELPFVSNASGLSVVEKGQALPAAIPSSAAGFTKICITGIDESEDISVSGYAKSSAGNWIRFNGAETVLNIPFDIRCYAEIGTDRVVGLESGLKKLGFINYETPVVEQWDEQKNINADPCCVCEYASGGDIMIAASGMQYLRYSRNEKLLKNGEGVDGADAWACVNMRISQTCRQAAVSNGSVKIYDAVKELEDITMNIDQLGLKPYDLNGFWQAGNVYYLCFGSSALKFTGFKTGMYFETVEGLYGKSLRSVQNVSGMLIIVPEEAGGLIVYDQTGDFCYIAGYYDNVDSFSSYMEDGQRIYVISNGNTVYFSTNLRSWKLLVQLPDAVEEIDCIFKAGKNQFIFLTDAGIYASKYQYEQVRDTYMMTEQDAWNIYENNIQTLSDAIDAAVRLHKDEQHCEDSNEYIFENLATVEFDIGLSDEISDVTDIKDQKYDYVKRLYTGSSDKDQTETVIARIKNSITDNEWTRVDCNWIARPYYSGVIDLDICLHTTNSYYIPHISGAGNVIGNPEQVVSRTNLAGSSTAVTKCDSVLSNNYTTIDVGVLSNVFNIDEVMNVQIQGNSLPKKVFIDLLDGNRNAEGPAADMYSSFAEPSLVDWQYVDQICADSAYPGYRMFRFYCFGTDQQAIKMTAYDSSRNYEKELYRIVLHGKGAYTDDGLGSVQMQVLSGDCATLRSAEIFTSYSSKMFMGWSQTDYSGSQPPDGTNLIGNGQTISFDTIRDGSTDRTFNLYAVWYDLSFDENSTTMTMQSNGTQFQIAEVQVDPTAIPELGNKLAVKFGD